ncbi:hypothetical protein M0R45_029345 [Rubus argutus]|uniref:Uncharacterized protein n=1 Tax=Rubus argutus TaxID=59490 RepID=A0AAW1W7Q5_RUBAR
MLWNSPRFTLAVANLIVTFLLLYTILVPLSIPSSTFAQFFLSSPSKYLSPHPPPHFSSYLLSVQITTTETHSSSSTQLGIQLTHNLQSPPSISPPDSCSSPPLPNSEFRPSPPPFSDFNQVQLHCNFGLRPNQPATGYHFLGSVIGMGLETSEPNRTEPLELLGMRIGDAQFNQHGQQ